VRDALLSEEPEHNAAAIQHIMNAVATIVHTRVMGLVDQRFQAETTARQSATTVEERSRQMTEAKEEYFKAFPGHREPLMQPIIASEAGQMAAQYPNLSWGPDYINALGARVNAAVAKLRGEPAQEPTTPTPAPAPAPKPAAGLPSGTRTAPVPGSELEGSDLIEDTFRI
jgi:hypothetical protein